MGVSVAGPIPHELLLCTAQDVDALRISCSSRAYNLHRVVNKGQQLGHSCVYASPSGSDNCRV